MQVEKELPLFYTEKGGEFCDIQDNTCYKTQLTYLARENLEDILQCYTSTVKVYTNYLFVMVTSKFEGVLVEL